MCNCARYLDLVRLGKKTKYLKLKQLNFEHFHWIVADALNQNYKS